jgi:hypothetical protein
MGCKVGVAWDAVDQAGHLEAAVLGGKARNEDRRGVGWVDEFRTSPDFSPIVGKRPNFMA